jgi:phosphorylcholine metabolism protein LicD
MDKNSIYFTLEILPENIILVKFMNNFIISKTHISSIFKIIDEQLYEYPLLLDISNIDGIDYEALEICKVKEVQQYNHRIAFLYDPMTISSKYADLLTNVNYYCTKVKPFNQLEAATNWAIG